MTMSRSEAARIAAHTRWAHEADRSATARRGHDGLMARFEREVDPDGVLSPDERTKRVKNAQAAHMARMRAKRRRTTTRT
jgi:hypothetical protein